MNYLRIVGAFAVILFISQMFAPQPAYAYLDPGTGSYLLQLMMAAILGSLFAIKLFWKRIKEFFTGAAPSGDDDNE